MIYHNRIDISEGIDINTKVNQKIKTFIAIDIF